MKSASPVRPEARLSSFFASVACRPFRSVLRFQITNFGFLFFFSVDSGWLFFFGHNLSSPPGDAENIRVDMINQHRKHSSPRLR